MRDLVFLFGAGASYGAGGIVPERPPLGFELFHVLAKFYPHSWGSLPSEIRDSFEANGQNFERGMEAVYKQAGYAIPILMRDMSLYFVQFRVVGQTCRYLELAQTLKARGLLNRSACATLNYECTLEHAFNLAGVAISYFDDSNNRCPVWKLHGSCNFFNSDLNAGPGISYGTGVSFEGGIKAFGTISETIDHCLNRTALAPVMSLYMAGKPLAISPSMIRHLHHLWQGAVQTASAVFTVGVNPNPNDEHVWAPITAMRGEHYFVGNKKSFESWNTKYRRNRSHHLGDRFAEALPNILSNF